MHVCFRECGVCIQCAWVFTLRIKSTCFQDDTLASVLWLLHCCYFFSSPEDQLYQVMWHKNVNSFICYDQVTENLSHASVVLQYKTTFWVKAGETALLVSCVTAKLQMLLIGIIFCTIQWEGHVVTLTDEWIVCVFVCVPTRCTIFVWKKVWRRLLKNECSLKFEKWSPVDLYFKIIVLCEPHVSLTGHW